MTGVKSEYQTIRNLPDEVKAKMAEMKLGDKIKFNLDGHAYDLTLARCYEISEEEYEREQLLYGD